MNIVKLNIYDKKIEDGGQIISNEPCIIETKQSWVMDGESGLVTNVGGSTFWTDKEGHDDLQAAFEKAYGKSCSN